jgi:choloylglycine hydrolase
MCTVLAYYDANGLIYTGRTLEFVGSSPNQLVYFPAGTRMESFTPAGKQGATFDTKYAIFGVLVGGVAQAKQGTLHEAMNEHGMSISTNSLGGNTSPDISGVKDSQIVATSDLGVWALGNFKTVAEVKQAIKNNEVHFWLPVIPALGTEPAPIHFALWDRTGAGIVIEWSTGKTEVYDNEVGVLTNNPPFPWHLENMGNYTFLTNIDKNTAQFNKLNVKAFDGGANMASLPSTATSPGRFVRAAYYSQFAYKGKTPQEAILSLSHVMNNFDRPTGISVDVSSDLPAGERSMLGAAESSASEVTSWTALKDLNQNHFYIRTIDSLNYSYFDMNQMKGLKTTTLVSMEALNANKTLDGNHLFLN